MKTYFYSDLIILEPLLGKLNELDISIEEKNHLLEILDSNLHHTVLDAILSELSEEDKRLFLEYVAENDHKKIWEFLHKRVDTIEEKIKKAATDLQEALHKDIDEVKKK